MDDYINNILDDLAYQVRRATEAIEQDYLSQQQGIYDESAMTELADALNNLTTRVNQLKSEFNLNDN